jgi:dihydroflavonol-4-reductase
VRVFVTGASGFVGNHLARVLVDRGDEVRCLVRSSSPRDLLGDLDVELYTGDLRDAESLRAGIRGVDVVYHCAADYRLFVPDPEAMYACNVDGTQNVLQVSAECGIERLVYTSTVGALGLHGDERPADETTPVSIHDMVGHYKRSKYLAERIAERWAGKGFPVVIVNPSAPVGDGDVKPTATGKMIVDFLNGKVPAYVDTGLNLVDVRDVAIGHVLAAERGKPGDKYILGNRNMTLKAIFTMLSELSGRPAPRVRMPHWVPMVFAALDTTWARLRGAEPGVSLDSVRLSRKKMFFDTGKAVRELGVPQTPVEEALRRAVTWFRDHGYAEETVH